MVPLLNDAGRMLRWFIEDVWGQFDDDRTRHGAPLFPSERKCGDGSRGRVGYNALRKRSRKQRPGICPPGRGG